jgi:hypothetical protein
MTLSTIKILFYPSYCVLDRSLAVELKSGVGVYRLRGLEI